MVQWINAGGTETKTEKSAFWRCQCFAPAVSAVACLISSRDLNQPHHITNAALLRGRWHRQKDKNLSPSAKNQTSEIRLSESANKPKQTKGTVLLVCFGLR